LILLRRVAVVFFIGLLPLHAQPQAWAGTTAPVPYVNTPMEIVERMLRMAEVKSGDTSSTWARATAASSSRRPSAERADSASTMTRGW